MNGAQCAPYHYYYYRGQTDKGRVLRALNGGHRPPYEAFPEQNLEHIGLSLRLYNGYIYSFAKEF